MQLLEAPAVVNQLLSEEVEQLRMCRRSSLQSEIIRCRNNPRAKVMMPNTIRCNAGQQVSCAVLRVRDPVGETRSSIARSGPARRRIGLPVLLRLSVSHQHLQKAGCGDARLLIRVTTIEKVRFGVKVLEATASGQVPNPRKTLA